jgi:hypothetical protein
MRPTAVECYLTLQRQLTARGESSAANAANSVYVSYHPSFEKVAEYIMHRLIQTNHCVEYRDNKTEKQPDLEYRPIGTFATDSDNIVLPEGIQNKMKNCKVVLVCLNSEYQSSANCMTELKFAMQSSAGICPVFIQSNKSEWLSEDVVYFCQLRSDAVRSADVSDQLSHADWLNDDGPTSEILDAFNRKIDVLLKSHIVRI